MAGVLQDGRASAVCGGSRAPTRLIFDDAEALETYLRDHVAEGDSFHFCRYDECCTDGNVAFRGKVSDANGVVPRGGAY